MKVFANVTSIPFVNELLILYILINSQLLELIMECHIYQTSFLANVITRHRVITKIICRYILSCHF